MCHTFHKVYNLAMVDDSLFLPDEIDFVLQDNDMLQLHDLQGSQMLLRLRLRADLIPCNEKERSVHDSST